MIKSCKKHVRNTILIILTLSCLIFTECAMSRIDVDKIELKKVHVDDIDIAYKEAVEGVL